MRGSRSAAKLPMEFLVNRLLPFIKKYTLLRIAVISRSVPGKRGREKRSWLFKVQGFELARTGYFFDWISRY